MALAPTVSAQTESGNGGYNTTDGPYCNYNFSGNYEHIQCSGYSRIAGGYVNYNCDINFNGAYFGNSSSYSYSCRDINGNTWRGSS